MLKPHWIACCLLLLVPLQPLRADETSVLLGPGKVAGDLWDKNGLAMKFRWCPSGKFTMGSPESDPERHPNENQVEVTLSKGIWLGQFEVTQAEYESVMGENPSFFNQRKLNAESSRHPVEKVSWEDAAEFCRELTTQERNAGRLPVGWEYTLPTEAQWEYACRAGTTSRFSFGNDESRLSDYGWWGGLKGDGNAQTERYTHSVGLKKPNAWNLHDMHGNVLEWCRDWYTPKLPGGTDPESTDETNKRVLRSGCWVIPAWMCRSASRIGVTPADQSGTSGFRVALVQVGPL